jgi:hypothetical protein
MRFSRNIQIEKHYFPHMLSLIKMVEEIPMFVQIHSTSGMILSNYIKISNLWYHDTYMLKKEE